MSKYQNQQGQTSCIDADPGYYVSVSGAAVQTACPPGTTSTIYGATYCSSLSDFVITVKTDNAGTSSSTQFTIPTTGGGYNYKGRLNRCQFIATTLTTSEREAAFNAGTMQGIIPDALFILDFDYTTTPISARTGTPAFPATEVGAPSKPIYLP